MKCKICEKEIEDEYMWISENGMDFGANTEETELEHGKNYFHRVCAKKKLAEMNNKRGEVVGGSTG